jgi:hypothetical protein
MSVIVQFEIYYQPVHFSKQKEPHTQNNNVGSNVVSFRYGKVGMQVLTTVDINISFFPERSHIGRCVGAKVSKVRAAAIFRVEASFASEKFVYIKPY